MGHNDIRLPNDSWRKARASSENGTGCLTVNLALAAVGVVGVRDSKHPDAAFIFPTTRWSGFVAAVRKDAFARTEAVKG